MQKEHECFAQKFMFAKGLKEFGSKGPPACKAELKQMHQRLCFKAIAVAELTRQERIRAQEGLMLLTKKKEWSSERKISFQRKEDT